MKRYLRYLQYILFVVLLIAVGKLDYQADGRKALIIRVVEGVAFGVVAVYFTVVVFLQLPYLGGATVSISLLSVLAIGCLIKMGVILVKALPDLIKNQISEYYITSWELIQGNELYAFMSSCCIKGCDQNGKVVRFNINKNTFIRLKDISEPYIILIKAYTRTRIVINAAVIKKF